MISVLTAITSPLVYLYFPVNTTCCTFPDNFTAYKSNTTDIDNIRSTSLTISSMDSVTLIFDTTNTDILTSQLNIGRTLFVCFLLIISSLLFTRDV